MAAFNVSIKSKTSKAFSNRAIVVHKYLDGRPVTSLVEAVEATRLLLAAKNDDPEKYNFVARPVELI